MHLKSSNDRHKQWCWMVTPYKAVICTHFIDKKLQLSMLEWHSEPEGSVASSELQVPQLILELGLLSAWFHMFSLCLYEFPLVSLVKVNSPPPKQNKTKTHCDH